MLDGRTMELVQPGSLLVVANRPAMLDGRTMEPVQKQAEAHAALSRYDNGDVFKGGFKDGKAEDGTLKANMADNTETSTAAAVDVGAMPSFIESTFVSRTEYDAWVANKKFAARMFGNVDTNGLVTGHHGSGRYGCMASCGCITS